MTKTLFLLRHAEAAAKESWQDDKARDLTSTGIKQSLHMGAWFREQNFSFDLIISSPAVRAEQTATLAAEGMKIDNPKIIFDDTLYEASVRHLLQCINNIEDANKSVLVVAHNPGISYLAEYLTKADIGDMAAGSVAIIQLDVASWNEVTERSGALVRYEAGSQF
jgi:phosphohistidine phosphatase